MANILGSGQEECKLFFPQFRLLFCNDEHVKNQAFTADYPRGCHSRWDCYLYVKTGLRGDWITIRSGRVRAGPVTRRRPRTSNPPMSWSIRCADGFAPGRASASTCSTCRPTSARPRKRSTPTRRRTTGRTSRKPIARHGECGASLRSNQRISTSSPRPGVIPVLIRVSPADCSSAMSYVTPPATRIGTSHASTFP